MIHTYPLSSITIPSLYPCLPLYYTDPSHISPPSTSSVCIKIAALLLPLQFLLIPLNL